MKNRSGLSLIEVMIAVMVFSFTITVFASLFPLAMRLRTKSENVSRATTLAQQKIEQLRSMPYANLTFTALRAANMIDASPTTSPFSITSVDSIASKLPQGTGTLTITTPATDLKKAEVTVTWGGIVANGNTVTVTTLIANKEVKVK